MGLQAGYLAQRPGFRSAVYPGLLAGARAVRTWAEPVHRVCSAAALHGHW